MQKCEVSTERREVDNCLPDSTIRNPVHFPVKTVTCFVLVTQSSKDDRFEIDQAAGNFVPQYRMQLTELLQSRRAFLRAPSVQFVGCAKSQ